MIDGEDNLVTAGLLVLGVLAEILVKLLDKRGVGCLGEARLLVDNGKETWGCLGQNHVKQALVVLVCDGRSIDTFTGVFIELLNQVKLKFKRN